MLSLVTTLNVIPTTAESTNIGIVDEVEVYSESLTAPTIVESLHGSKVLFDAYRSSFWTPSVGSGFFSKLAMELRRRGYTVDELTGPITPEALNGYSTFVIASPDSSLAYTSDEVNAVQSFVSSGHGLFLLGETIPSPPPSPPWINYDTLNSMANPFGVNFMASVSSWNPLTLIPPHPILENVLTVVQYNGDHFELTDTLPVTILATNNLGNALGVASYEAGRVVFYSDCNTFDDQMGINLYKYDHLQLAMNIFSWLSPIVSEPATIDINPDTLNLKSNGEWITTYITLPEGYNVEDIDLETVGIDGISAAWSDIQNGMYMAKFDRATVRSTFTNEPDYESAPKFYELTLIVIGQLTDGTLFEGSDTITVIKK